LDEFPERYDQEPEAEPASWRRALVVIVAAGVVVTLAGFYFYGFSGFSREAATSGGSFALPPAATDTEVAVAADEPVAPETAVAGAGQETEAVVAPPVVAPPEVIAAGSEPAAPGVGQLVIRSSPAGALVTLDGTRAGTTPVSLSDVPFGQHVVQVARPGFVPAVETIELGATSPSRTLTITLVQGSDAGGPAVGSLFVDTRPRGATVTLDGRRVGTTPVRLADVAAGTHVVQVELAGYRTVRADVRVERGEASRLALTLEPGRR
jgi:hypothetical protein